MLLFHPGERSTRGNRRGVAIVSIRSDIDRAVREENELAASKRRKVKESRRRVGGGEGGGGGGTNEAEVLDRPAVWL